MLLGLFFADRRLIAKEKLRVVDGSVMMHLAPAAAGEAKHAGGAELQLQGNGVGLEYALFPADRVKNLAGIMDRVIAKIEAENAALRKRRS